METDIHVQAQLIKAYTDVQIIFEAISRLYKELLEIRQSMSKQETGNLFSKN